MEQVGGLICIVFGKIYCQSYPMNMGDWATIIKYRNKKIVYHLKAEGIFY